MRVEEVTEKSYVKKILGYRNDYFWFKFYKTRPVKTEDNKIYKINKIYKVFFNKEDIKETFRLQVSPTNTHAFTDDFFKMYLHTLQPSERSILHIVQDKEGTRENAVVARENIEDEIFFEIFSEQDLIELTNLSAADKKYIEQKEQKEVDKKLINTVLLSSVQAICDKWGLEYDSNWGRIRFKDSASMKTFFAKVFEDTVIKDFKESGIELKFNKRIANIKLSSELFNIDRMKLMLDNK